jgi:thiosulfate dehydrogenase [quinone] large subunit
MERATFNYKAVAVALAAFLGSWLLLRGTDFELSASQQLLSLVGGLVLFLASIIFLFRDYHAPAHTAADEIGEPAIARFLFTSTKSAPLWLGARIFLGYEWLDAGRHKVTEDAWMSGGAALQGYWTRAVEMPETGSPKAAWGVYRELIQYMLDNGWYTWFAKVIAIGEVAIGLGLILGALTGLAAFSGALLNMSFLLAGTVSTNPILFFVAIFIILGWRVAGWIGVDRVLLPKLGAPWNGGNFLGREDDAAATAGTRT